ncbi:EndoU domain-containing protein [Brevibacillus daliensis]|uniref:EndoU domain-containing protein n=1 Tax=Brevibacillus daliensis TaxID=2892995 RepID=UPI001E2CA77C|nr:EndoU domain-containing protein [Brevibacillus daliensis]
MRILVEPDQLRHLAQQFREVNDHWLSFEKKIFDCLELCQNTESRRMKEMYEYEWPILMSNFQLLYQRLEVISEELRVKADAFQMADEMASGVRTDVSMWSFFEIGAWDEGKAMLLGGTHALLQDISWGFTDEVGITGVAPEGQEMLYYYTNTGMHGVITAASLRGMQSSIEAAKTSAISSVSGTGVAGIGVSVAFAGLAAGMAMTGATAGKNIMSSGQKYADAKEQYMNARNGAEGTGKAEPSKVVNALENFQSKKFTFDNQNFLLDKRGMKHILERHHSEYWDGSIKAQQTFLKKDMSIDEVANAIESIMKQNRDTLLKNGTAFNYQIKGTYNGVEYVVGFNKGRVGQFYPE